MIQYRQIFLVGQEINQRLFVQYLLCIFPLIFNLVDKLLNADVAEIFIMKVSISQYLYCYIAIIWLYGCIKDVASWLFGYPIWVSVERALTSLKNALVTDLDLEGGRG